MHRRAYDVLLACVFIALAAPCASGCSAEVAPQATSVAAPASAEPDAETPTNEDLERELDTLEAEIGR